MAKTKSGFEYTLTDERKGELAKDWEYLEAFETMENEGNPIAIVTIAKKMFQGDDYKRLKEHCTVDGVVLTEKIVEVIIEIANSEDELKK